MITSCCIAVNLKQSWNTFKILKTKYPKQDAICRTLLQNLQNARRAIMTANKEDDAQHMRKAKVDTNQEAIVQALRAAGATVQSLASVGHGVPDLLVGFRNQTVLLEVKDGAKSPSQRRLTEDQIKWHGQWTGGVVAVVDSVESALRVLGVINES